MRGERYSEVVVIVLDYFLSFGAVGSKMPSLLLAKFVFGLSRVQTLFIAGIAESSPATAQPIALPFETT